MNLPTARAKIAKRAIPTPGAIIKTLVAGGAQRVAGKAHAVLFNQGQPSERIYFVVEGRVEGRVVSAQGKEGTIASYGRGDFVGEASLSKQPLYLDSAVVVVRGELLALTSQEMREILQKSEPTAAYFTNFLLQRTLDVQAELVDHLFNSSEKRLARVLLLLANFGKEGKLQEITNVTHDMLAQRVGTTRARISFFMNKFRRLGLIDYNGKIQVHSGLLNVVLFNSRLDTTQSEAR